MHVTATAKYVRISPQKVLAVTRNLPPKPHAQDLLQDLQLSNTKGARVLLAVLQSALANAKQKSIDTNSLLVETIRVNKGFAMKRFRAASRGMAHGYKKRTSHVEIVLAPKQEKNNTAS